ncbi:MAG: ATPase [Desulfobacterales bacterium CG23_combo_of_CG06-09_8_20_14_all_51_8]|nr:MAG: ATPase [Desulfobacterales bacterium CG23_combo_of_CG06-09_8_20_14_all_51_8]
MKFAPYKNLLKIHPATLIISSFAGLITIGTLLLKLPMAAAAGQIPLIDAVFMAASAVCVTGLTVVDTGNCFTAFGQGVILVLIQIGGLGVMTVSVMLFKLVGRSIGFRQRKALQDMFAHTPRKDIFHLLKTIFIFTAIAESIGAGLLFIYWLRFFPAEKALYLAVFHSISAFSNAGFSVFSDNLCQARAHWLPNFTLCLLIILGGIGFPVANDVYYRLKSSRENSRPRLSVQTKVVLTTTLVLIVFGAAGFWILEQPHILAGRSLSEALLISVFQSVTCRTAGFNTVDIARLTDATLMMMLVLMFFGASPGSCGGGIKTTSIALIAAFTVSRIRKKKRVSLFKKSIPAETVSRCVSLILVCSSLIGVILFLILAGNSLGNSPHVDMDNHFMAYLFETVSAFGTVGLSMGVTSTLSLWGKCWIIALMFIGRVGVLTFAYIVVGGGIASGIEYSEENIMIG